MNYITARPEILSTLGVVLAMSLFAGGGIARRYLNLGVLKAALGQPAEAEAHFREARRDDPNNPVTYTHYARWLQSVGRTEEARLFTDAAVRLSPADADATRLLNDITSTRSKSVK